MPPKNRKKAKNKAGQTGHSDTKGLDIEHFREYQLAKWCRPDKILDGAQLVVDKTDEEFDSFISHLEGEPSYHMLVASFSVVQVFQQLNQQIEDIHRQVVDVENFDPDRLKPSKKQQVLGDEIQHIEQLKQKVQDLNDELISYERAYCNGSFFDPGNYLKSTVGGCSDEGSDLSVEPVNLYTLISKRVCQKFGLDADLACFYARIVRLTQALSIIKKDSSQCPKVSLDILFSYIDRVDQLSKHYPEAFESIQAYPRLLDVTNHYTKVNNATSAILVPSETVFLKLFELPRKQSNSADQQWLKECYINSLIAIFLASINNYSYQSNAEQLKQYVFDKDQRQHFSPQFLFKSLERSEQRLNSYLQAEKDKQQQIKQQQKQQQERERTKKEQAGVDFLGRCFEMQQRYSIVRQMFDDALEDAIYNPECDYLTWPLSNQIQQIEQMARHIACVDSYDQSPATHDTSQIQQLSHDVDEVLQKLNQDRKDDSTNNLGDNITFFNSVNRQVSTVMSHLNHGELSLEDLGGQLISNSSPYSTSPTK